MGFLGQAGEQEQEQDEEEDWGSVMEGPQELIPLPYPQKGPSSKLFPGKVQSTSSSPPQAAVQPVRRQKGVTQQTSVPSTNTANRQQRHHPQQQASFGRPEKIAATLGKVETSSEEALTSPYAVPSAYCLDRRAAQLKSLHSPLPTPPMQITAEALSEALAVDKNLRQTHAQSTDYSPLALKYGDLSAFPVDPVLPSEERPSDPFRYLTQATTVPATTAAAKVGQQALPSSSSVSPPAQAGKLLSGSPGRSSEVELYHHGIPEIYPSFSVPSLQWGIPPHSVSQQSHELFSWAKQAEQDHPLCRSVGFLRQAGLWA